MGLPPIVRIDGDMIRVKSTALDSENVRCMLDEIMTDQQREDFDNKLEIDFSFDMACCARFRVNAFNQNRGVAVVLRTIPSEVHSLETLDSPQIFRLIAALQKGLVLFTGPTGSGKSTTLAAMIDYKNQTEYGHILTIEDPIEFIHSSQKCPVNQREIDSDTNSFKQALRSALREDPDTILVGELRDLETISLAPTAAETGHLVFATLHTSSAAKSIDRIIDVFPANDKDMVRSMLSESLQAVVSQTLCKKNWWWARGGS